MLAAMKLGAVVIPATTLLTADDLRDRIDARRASATWSRRRAQAGKFAGAAPATSRASRRRAGGRAGALRRCRDGAARTSRPTARRAPTDPLLLYFTSGTTAKPKLVLHTHASYPVGHLSTMYWIGLQPGDVH